MIYTPERRFYPFADAELRVVDTDKGTKKIIGRAAVFNKLSQDLGGFKEKLDRKSFENCLKRCDVRGLRNHDSNHLLGRTKSGTMRLWTEDDALYYDIDVPETQEGRDTTTLINRGDIDGSSFSFTIGEGGDRWERSGDEVIRTVNEVRDLFDVGPVTYPAYLQTSTGTRMLGECRSFDQWKESQVQLRLRSDGAAKEKRIRILKLQLGLPILEGA